ncbi:hypothetical protein BHM03_00043165 [Ensete ventricosum]|nr:hypothetical protein BHM03_00043165 [Ensete ventricosum]
MGKVGNAQEGRILAGIRCPPPPKKRSPAAVSSKRRGPSKNGYFHPPDLEALFALAHRRAPCS